jgi:hypothetical protein
LNIGKSVDFRRSVGRSVMMTLSVVVLELAPDFLHGSAVLKSISR